MAYVGNSPTQQSFTGGVDQYNGNNSNTVFGLTRTINTVYDVDAYVENVWQRPTTGYTVSANTITFTSAPPAGSNNVVVVYRNFSATSIVPQQGSVTHTAFAANAIPTALGYTPANKAGDTFSGAVSGITTLAVGNTTITGTANISQGLTSNTLTVSTNTATVGTALYVVANGSVGVGTATPGAGIKLDVVGGEIKAGRIDSSSEGGQVSFGRASDNSTAWYIDAYGNTSTPSLRFVDVGAGAVSVGINSSGAMALRGAASASGVGITFPSTQVASSDANTLDDYEEGTWTPDVVNNGKTSSWTVKNGYYRKIGGLVWVTGQCDSGASGASSGGALIIGGLPFNVVSAGSASWTFGTSWCSTQSANAEPIVFYGGASNGAQIWYANLSGQDQARLTTGVIFSFCYPSS